ncbi:MAG: UvrB/UvrC motif-containing protein, partial [bacterium]|nr:UvrB/UvrC motif-containing protein [bacterium]
MRCEDCGEREAAVLFTEIAGKQKAVCHLCKVCADKRSGADDGMTISVDAIPTLEGNAGMVCPECGTTFATFRKGGRFGCASCYAAFEPGLESLFKRIHGVGRHKKDSGNPGLQARMDFLEQQLKQLVDQEAFEEAARVRDLIAEIQTRPG